MISKISNVTTQEWMILLLFAASILFLIIAVQVNAPASETGFVYEDDMVEEKEELQLEQELTSYQWVNYNLD
ncbi:hypothetical protein ATL39_0981 [Sinobaca qinghaiensis]|uniref:Uncharacterized protein n=1 Tax=Sinobaca qinghaiensis TaxID=342944 RepID=A0A419V5L7_9BACL|nr:hypothetical protein [Sinobaca qinghaiensis]RKD75282.1 hypothetical protein ATL39_0981 [Sinobaca qinghaiensis]